MTARLPKKKLRLPVGDEWDNLPEGRHEARKRGLNRYLENGELFELRRSNTDTYPQGKPERVASRKANRGKRSSKTKYYTEQEFIEWGRRNGWSTAEAKAKFQSHKEQGRGVFKKQKFNVDIDHMQPHSSDFQNPGETHRNKAPLETPINLKKSNKLQTREERIRSGTPSSKAAAIRAEFRNEPIVSDDIKTEILTKVANDPTRETATQQNKRLKQANIRRQNLMKQKGYGIFKPESKTAKKIRNAGFGGTALGVLEWITPGDASAEQFQSAIHEGGSWAEAWQTYGSEKKGEVGTALTTAPAFMAASRLPLVGSAMGVASPFLGLLSLVAAADKADTIFFQGKTKEYLKEHEPGKHIEIGRQMTSIPGDYDYNRGKI